MGQKDKMNFVLKEIEKAIALLTAMRSDNAIHGQIKAISDVCTRVIQGGGKVMFCGNGGSAGDSQHLAAELVGKLIFARPGMAGIALTTDTSALTAIGNDFGFEYVFSRQVEAIGHPGDALFGISTSGNSPNVLEAFRAARDKDIRTIGLTGASGGKFHSWCDYMIKIPSSETQKIQEGHIVLGHIICALIEAKIHGEGVAC